MFWVDISHPEHRLTPSAAREPTPVAGVGVAREHADAAIADVLGDLNVHRLQVEDALHDVTSLHFGTDSG